MNCSERGGESSPNTAGRKAAGREAEGETAGMEWKWGEHSAGGED